jgi:FkbM family methyltransferase
VRRHLRLYGFRTKASLPGLAPATRFLAIAQYLGKGATSMFGRPRLQPGLRRENLVELFDVRRIARLSRAEGEARIRALCHSVYLGDHDILCRCLGRYKVYPDARDLGVGPHIMMEGFWEYWITQFVLTVVKPGMAVMDVGANFGYYALLFSDLVGPDGKCIAVEPNPLVAKHLDKTIRVNGFAERCSMHAVALGREDGTASLHVPENDYGGASVCAGRDGPGVVRVPLMALDRICEGLHRLDFLKIDAEGSEPAIIDGAAATIARLRPSLLLEFSVHNGDRRLLDRLASIYGPPRVVDYDGAAKPVSIEALLQQPSAHPHMLYFA